MLKLFNRAATDALEDLGLSAAELRSFRRRFSGRNPALIYQLAMQHRRDIIAGEAAAVASYRQAADRSIKRLEREIQRLEKRLDQALSDGAEISPSVAYRRTRAQEFINRLETEAVLLAGETRSAIDGSRSRMIRTGVQHGNQAGMAAVLSAGISESFTTLSPGPLEAILGTTSPGTPLTNLLQRMGTEAAESAREVLLDGIARGRGPREIGRRLAKVTRSMTADRGLLIARTEMIRAYRIARQETFKANEDVIIGQQWVAAHDDRTCPACLARDGQRFSIDYVLQSHPGCRCAMVPIVEGSEPFETGAEWFDRQPENVQRQIVGPTRLELLQRGHIRFEQLATPTRSEEWGDGLQVTSIRRLEELARR